MDAVDALSFLSNVLSIVTFLFTISIALLGFYTLTSNALREIETLQEEWDGAGKEIYLLLRYWDAEKKRGNEMLENYLRTLQSSLDSLAETALFILRESRSLKSPSTADEPARLGVFDLKRRVIWIYKRQIILGKMAEFSRRRQALIHMQLSLLLTYVACCLTQRNLNQLKTAMCLLILTVLPVERAYTTRSRPRARRTFCEAAR